MDKKPQSVASNTSVRSELKVQRPGGRTTKRMGKNDLNLTKPEKRVAAKVMTEAGYSSREIESFLGISDDTVLRAAKDATPDQLRQFEAEFNTRIAEMKRTGVGMVQKRLLELIPKERRMDQLVKAGDYLEGKTGSQQTNVQVNVAQPILGPKEAE